MNMGDVFAFFGAMLTIGIALPGMLLASPSPSAWASSSTKSGTPSVRSTMLSSTCGETLCSSLRRPF